MNTNFKNIYIGQLIKQRMQECAIVIERASAFLNVSEDELERMFDEKSLDCNILLRWSKLLNYDFFRIYTQHLILYAPQDPNKANRKAKTETSLPVFKKNIYTQEVISYLIELVDSNKMTLKQVQETYNIPSTTVMRWKNKYGKVKS